MKNPFNAGPPSFDAHAINETIRRALASAGLDTTSGPMHEVTETIRRALAGGRPGEAAQRFDSESVIDVDARHMPADEDGGAAPDHEPSIDEAPQRPGSFETRHFSNEAGTRSYKVYVPAAVTDAPRAMVVMLHGCTQTALQTSMASWSCIPNRPRTRTHRGAGTGSSPRTRCVTPGSLR